MFMNFIYFTDEIEVNFLKTVSKEDLIKFYKVSYDCPLPFRRKAEGHGFCFPSFRPSVCQSVLPSPYRSMYLVQATPPTILFRFF